MAEQGLSLDLRVYRANDTTTLNILSGRTGVIDDNGQLDDKSFKLATGEYTNLPPVPNGKAFILYSYHPVDLTMSIGTQSNIEIPGQTLFVITSHVNNVVVKNSGSETTQVKVIKFSSTNAQTGVLIPEQLITFDSLSRITALPRAITNIDNVEVMDVTLSPWQNDQTTEPGTGSTVYQKYRICDSSGTANSNGTHIMILDDTISQQNFSGTLQLWVSEIS